jgi:hypothetical protein
MKRRTFLQSIAAVAAAPLMPKALAAPAEPATIGVDLAAGDDLTAFGFAHYRGPFLYLHGQMYDHFLAHGYPGFMLRRTGFIPTGDASNDYD